MITLNNAGGTAPATAGGGSLANIVQAAVDYWEGIYAPTSGVHNLTLNFLWATLSDGTLATHVLLSESGTPHRETSGTIRFSNAASTSFFLDSTPLDNSEWLSYTETTDDLGGGTLITGKEFTNATGFANGRHDLFTVALHEIGHALGLSSENNAYVAETGDGEIDVTSGPFMGSTIETGGTLNAHLDPSEFSSALMLSVIPVSIRRLPSEVDILANAQISQFGPDFDFSPVPEPSAAFVLLGGLAGAVICRRRLVRRVAHIPSRPISSKQSYV